MNKWIRFARYLLTGSIPVFFCGCALLGPNFTPPQSPLAPEWQEREGLLPSEAPSDYREWWMAFDDPVLGVLVQAAYEQNLPLRIAGLRVLQARAQLGVASGNLYPQTQEFGADYNYNRASNPSPGESRYFQAASFGFDAAWEVDLWGKYRRSVQSAEDDLGASITAYDGALVTLTAEVARTYIQIRTFEERIRLAEENVKIQERALQLSDVRFKTGAVSELDVEQAKTVMNTTRAQIYALRLSLRKAYNALSILLGMPPEDLGSLLGGPGAIPAAPAEVAVGIPADLLRRRPDIRQAELEAAAQCAQIGVSKSELFPSVSLLGTLGWSANDAAEQSLGSIFGASSYGFSFGPSVRWQILNYGRLVNQVRVQDAVFQQQLISYSNVVLNAAREVEDAMAGFILGRKEAEYLLKSVQASKRTSEISMVQYRDGAITFQPVLSSTRSLSEQQDQYAQKRGDVAVELVALYKALGGGWQVRLGKDFVPPAVQKEMRERTYWGKILPLSNEEFPAVTENVLWKLPDW